jgi:hypothetical protein
MNKRASFSFHLFAVVEENSNVNICLVQTAVFINALEKNSSQTNYPAIRLISTSQVNYF